MDQVGSRGGSLLIRGEAGIGKSALLRAAASRAERLKLGVLSAAGVPSETQMAFAGLSQLLRPLLPRMPELPGPQRDALSSAFGISDAGAPDAFLIALAALNMLADKASGAPLLVLVEDAHWLDAASWDVLSFVSRRVEMEPIVLLMTARGDVDGRLHDARLPELRLDGLDEASAATLLDSQERNYPPPVRRRLLETAAGNPLALVELPRSLDAGSFDGRVHGTPLPITERVERAFSGQVSELPPATRTLLLVAALDEGGGLRAVLDAGALIEGRELTLDDLAPAEEARLVLVAKDGVRFRHPLVRAAIAQGATMSARHAAHAGLAKVHVSDPDRSVWHRAASLATDEDQVCAELEAAAGRALRRGAPQVAAAALERAAQLSADDTRRGALLLRAAEMEFDLGRSDWSARLLAETQALDLDPHARVRRSLLVELLEDSSSAAATKVGSLVKIAEQMSRLGEPERALDILLKAAMTYWWGNPDESSRATVTAAAERIQGDPRNPALLAILAFADPVGRGASVADRIAAMTPDVANPVGMYLVGAAANAVWAYDLSTRFLETAVDGLRTQGRLGLLAQALVTQAWAAVHLAREPLAIAAAEEGVRLARETGQSRWAAAAQFAQATIAAERGDFAAAEALMGSAEAIAPSTATNSLRALAQFVHGRAAVAHQRYAEGYDHLRRVLDPTDPAHHPFVGAWGLSDLVEAATHTGRGDIATAYLDRLESLASTTGGSLLRAQAGYARTMVADDERSEDLYQTALERDLASWPCFRGRMLLWYGRWLRRQRRVAESRVPLRAARESFDALEFSALAECARQELRASGEVSRRHEPEAWGRLTPQELQIGRMAAAGLSNREIGEKLYLSHRTVGSHLHRMFPKLGVTSRTQLRDVIPDSAPAQQAG